MKIIKRGVPPQENTYRFSCSICKSVLECKEREMCYKSDIRNQEWWDVLCPVCNHMCFVYESNRVKNSASAEDYYKK